MLYRWCCLPVPSLTTMRVYPSGDNAIQVMLPTFINHYEGISIRRQCYTGDVHTTLYRQSLRFVAGKQEKIDPCVNRIHITQVTNEYSGKPAHSCTLARVFTICTHNICNLRKPYLTFLFPGVKKMNFKIWGTYQNCVIFLRLFLNSIKFRTFH